MKHSNYFIICLQSIVENIIELFVVCQQLSHDYANFKVTNLTSYMYLFIEI